MWDSMKDWLKEGAEIPDDPELEIDLTGPQCALSNKGALTLERKEDMKRRGLASTDIGDALAMSFAVPLHQRMRERKDWYEDLLRYRYRAESENEWMMY
jgi:hypothetical protein